VAECIRARATEPIGDSERHNDMTRHSSGLLAVLMLLGSVIGSCTVEDGDGPSTDSQTADAGMTRSGSDPEVPGTSSSTTRATSKASDGPGRMCTAAGCDSLLTIELTDVDVQPEETYDVEVCVDDRCAVETITIDIRHPGTGEVTRGESERTPGTVEGWMLVWAEDDRVEYYLPSHDYGDVARVSFALSDATGNVLASISDVEVPLERSQPNGPDCPPVCFWGRLAV